MNKYFKKMHGLGNDFAVFDGRQDQGFFCKETIVKVADRRYGVGCDQLLVLENSSNKSADLFLRIFNADGSEAKACGNGTRCVAKMYMDETDKSSCVIQTGAGLLTCRSIDTHLIEVDMGKPLLRWQEIPLAKECDTLNLGMIEGPLNNPVAVNMGNPHVVFFVDNLDSINISDMGSQVERNVMFPERTNVEFVKVLASDRMRVRVWERGTGITQACGSGACATIVASVRRGLSRRKAEIVLDGGSLLLEWRELDEHVLMTGPAEYVYEGTLYSEKT